jgi:uncharacterized membrane protein (DUF2068 family)
MVPAWHGSCVSDEEGLVAFQPVKARPRGHALKRTTRHGPDGLRLIGGYKLGKAVLLLAVGCGLLELLRSDVAECLERWSESLWLDPGNHLLREFISRVAAIDRRYLAAIGFGTIATALLNAVEGVGLWLQKPWAEYLTVIATASLLPFEAISIIEKPRLTRFVVALLNLAILGYLVHRLRQDRSAGDVKDQETNSLV